MQSNPNAIDEVVTRELYGALPTELRRDEEAVGQSLQLVTFDILSYALRLTKVAPVGLEPTTPGSQSMYSESAVDRVRK